MSLLPKLEKIFSEYNLRPVKFRGQNFLVDEEVLDEVLAAAEIKSDETILEIGPGLGFLTERLVARAKKVIAVELDARLFKILREKFSATKNLELINEDILKINPTPIVASLSGGFQIAPPLREDPERSGVPAKAGERDVLMTEKNYKIVANIPYGITSPILAKFLTCAHPPREIILMAQREVAERIVAEKKRSLLAIFVNLYGAPEIVATVPREAFFPVPRVESAILRIAVKNLDKISRESNEKALKIAKIGFSHPRKKLLGNLAGGLRLKKDGLAEIFEKIGINKDVRAEELGPKEWLALADYL